MFMIVEALLVLSFVVGGLLYLRVGRSKTEEERDKNKKITLLALSPLILCLIGGVLFGGYWFITSSQSPLNKESSSLSSSSSSNIITEQQLYKIVKGCCSGVGGTYRSSYDEGCVVDSEQDKPFRDCVGKGKVKYPNGKIGYYYGSKFTR